MDTEDTAIWKEKVVSPDVVLTKIKPGMSIFLGTGVAEPRTLVKHLTSSTLPNLSDLELIQIVSLGDVIDFSSTKTAQKYRLKTFFAGWTASKAIMTGSVDMIPCRLSQIPKLFDSGAIRIDVAFVQITPPDGRGYSSLGVSVDIAKHAIDHASIVVGEINDKVPRTLGNTFVHVNEFDFMVYATEPPLYFPRWPYDDVADKIAYNVASVIEDGSCISFYSGALFEALGKRLADKRDLGIHTFVFTDPLMDLVVCGAVTNKKKGYFHNKSLTSYAQGTPELMKWLHRNPLIEFQGIDVVSDYMMISKNDKMIAILPARKIDLTGGIALPIGKGNVTGSPGQVHE
jgi:acyl-CoA hydrolase